MDQTIASSPRRRSASIATFLSFLWPGLGQAYLGRRRAAIVFAVPVLAAFLLLLSQVGGGAEVLAVRAFTPAIAGAALWLIVLTAVWRLVSMADAFGGGVAMGADGRSHVVRSVSPWRDRRSVAIFAALAGVVVVLNAALAYGAWAFYDAGSKIFVTGDGPAASPNPLPSGAGGDIGVLPTPYVTPENTSSRINILLLGVDSGMGYQHSLSDTMIVVSIDPTTDKVTMLSLPRDIGRFPMYNGGTFPGKINALLTTAAANPTRYPDGGLGTLSREVGYLLGVPIHYYALVDLAGFKTMIDTVGGVDIVNQRAIADPVYEFPDGKVGFYLSAGKHHLDGRTALAYVRSRQGAGDNDFTRARRQQDLLVALRAKITSPAMLPKLPAVLAAAAKTIKTDLPPDRVSALLAVAKDVTDSSITHYVLGPPYATHPPDAQTGGTYMLIIDQARFQRLSVQVFGSDSAFYQAAASPSLSPSP